MFKKICFCIGASLLLIAGDVRSQELNPQVVLSEVIDEPTSGGARIVQLKNGNTLFFNFSSKAEVETIVFDANHKKLASLENRLQAIRSLGIGKGSFRAAFEVNGQVAVFFVDPAKSNESLYCFTFDGNTGKLLEEKLIGERDAKSKYTSYQVAADPESGNYAIATIHSYKEGGLLKITHYSASGQVINEGNYERTENWFSLLDMYVHGADYVIVNISDVNEKARSGKVLIARLSKENHTVATEVVTTYGYGARPSEGRLKYNPANKQLYLFITLDAEYLGREYTMRGWGGDYVLKMNIIDPLTLKTSVDKYIECPSLTTYSEQHLKHKGKYSGIIQNFQLNKDGSASLMFEDFAFASSPKLPAGIYDFGPALKIIGDMGVARVNNEGADIGGSYAIAKTQYGDNNYHIFSSYNRTRNLMEFDASQKRQNGYLSLNHLFINDQLYLLYNNLSENINDEEGFKRKENVSKIGKTNTMLVWFDGTKIHQQYLFGDPQKLGTNRYSRLDLNAFSADGKSFATLLVERNGSKYEAHIAWVKF
ncbi:hypothetical protein [Chitinophaga sp. Cy-1792]|uniref:hypothetical protein n=1 Tax=Chitinophaga sp. Cy-1792 TaxID=2608339 RepID=UPI001423A045|nr:hypothetical protein [Chitinophaga sp. Cy-1792]NIG53636.1 hypothetical protein [Chitinophaga sp. Cy-1792]